MKHISQILTSEIGEKWVQPEIFPDLPKIGDRVESLHRLSKGVQGTVTGVYSKSISYQPDGKDHEVYLITGQFSIIKEDAQTVKNCSNCERSLETEEGLWCPPKNEMVRPDDFCEELYYPKRKRSHQCFEDKSKPIHTCLKHPKHLDNPDGCDQFQPKSKSPSKTCGPCSECNSFDTSIPKDSLWQFCLSKGKYLPQNELEGCEDFKPIVPYQSPSKKRRERGDGSGQIQLHYYEAKNGKSYEQYYYHYEIRENGMRQRKGSRYIPVRKLDLIREMEADKKPIVTILYELGLIV